jgi:hypothetical protein
MSLRREHVIGTVREGKSERKRERYEPAVQVQTNHPVLVPSASLCRSPILDRRRRRLRLTPTRLALCHPLPRHLLPQPLVRNPFSRDLTLARLLFVELGEDASKVSSLDAEGDRGDNAVFGGGKEGTEGA